MSNPLSDPEFVAGLRPIPSGQGEQPPSWPAVDVTGVDPDGSPASVELDEVVGPLLLVFLSTNCDGCDVFWTGLADPPPGVEVVAVTKDPDASDRAEVARLARSAVVMSSAAWVDYRVSGYPFLVLVDPASRRILGEAVGFQWSDVAALVQMAE